MRNRQFCIFLMLATLSLFEHHVTTTSGLEAHIGIKKNTNIRFRHSLSVCPLSNGDSCNKKNKLTCGGIYSCKREEVVKVNPPGSFEFLLSGIPPATQLIRLRCNYGDTINITDIVHFSPGDFRGFCKNHDKECVSVNESTICNKPHKCWTNHTFKMPNCEYRDFGLISKLQRRCLKWKKGSCEVSIPIKKMDNYDTCVNHDDKGEVKCSDAISYCYSKEAMVHYTCVPPSLYD